MAKDREKSTSKGTGSNTDGEKAITFQRAVFIVCNLKRLIKGPKKQDKHNASGAANAGHSRKRSGETSTGADNPHSGFYALYQQRTSQVGVADVSGRLKFRGPVRRAFTLPTMLCSSIMLPSGGGGMHQLDESKLPLIGSTGDHEDAPPLTISPPRTQLRFDWPTSLPTTRKSRDDQDDEAAAARSPRGYLEGYSPVATCWRDDSDCRLDARVVSEAPRSIASLATPVRRPHSQQAAKTSSILLSDFSSEKTTAGGSQLELSFGGLRRRSSSESRRQKSGPQSPGDNQQQLLCPIWLLAMQLLDRQQNQPRDHSQFAHLIGAPAAQSFLLEPQRPSNKQQCEPAESSANQSETTTAHPDDHNNSHWSRDRNDATSTINLPKTDDNCGADGAISRGSSSNSSINSVRSNRRHKEYPSPTAERNSKKQQTKQMKRFSSAMCLNDQTSSTRPFSIRWGDSRAQSRQKHQNQSVGKSYLIENLYKNRQNERVEKDKNSGLHSPNSPSDAKSNRTSNQCSRRGGSFKTKHKQAQQQTSGKQAKSCAKAKNNYLTCPADDPLVCQARQRRPSATDQETLNVDQQALFSAVECNQLERTKIILENGKVNVNSLNGDKLTCLDIAVLTRNVEMANLLLQHNAKESSAYLAYEGRANQLYSLYMEARRLVEDLSKSLDTIAVAQQQQQRSPSLGAACSTEAALNSQQVSASGAQQQQLMLATGSLLSSALLEEKQRQLQYWRRRLDLFMHLRYEFERLAIPNGPELVVLQVVGECSLGVKIVHSTKISSNSSHLECCAGRSSTSKKVREKPNDQDHSNQGQGREQDSTLGEEKSAERLNSGRLYNLAQLVRERNLTCPLGAKCSHWLIDELRAFAPCAPPPPAEWNLSALQAGAPKCSEHRQQRSLAIFNQLLAQQLTILTNQQQQQLHKFLSSQQPAMCRCSERSAPSGMRSALERSVHSQRLMMYQHHHNESTDSARDTIAAHENIAHNAEMAAAAVASAPWNRGPTLPVNQRARSDVRPASRNDTTTVGLLLPSTCCAALAPVRQPQLPSMVAYNQQQDGHYSLAYQLMTNMQYRKHDFCELNNFCTVCKHSDRKRCGEMIEQTQCHEQPNSIIDNTSVIITKYRVEWSLNEQMDPIVGSMIVYRSNSCPLECQIDGLVSGQLYFVRVSSGNHRGFSRPRRTIPICLAPSSWRQVTDSPQGSSDAAGDSAKGLSCGATHIKRRKYDEQVFQKFTKLILLNKHISDDHNHGQLLDSMRIPVDGQATAKGTDKNGIKSSLINMLLSEAPTVGVNYIDHRKQQSNRQQCNLSDVDCLSSASSGRTSDEQTIISAAAQLASAGAKNDDDSEQQQQQQQQQSSMKVRKNLKNFFQSNTFKFHKLNNQNKRGLYLTTVIYHSPARLRLQEMPPNHATKRQSLQADPSFTSRAANDSGQRILVTNDDRLPIIEAMNDLVSPSALMSDFYWLLKINGTRWSNIKRLRQQLQKSHSSSTLHLRIKLLTAIEQMQLALNIEDIGRLFYKPIQAHDGSIIICTCRHVSDTKLVSNLCIKWTQQHKIVPRNLRKISEAIQLNNKLQEQTERENFELRQQLEKSPARAADQRQQQQQQQQQQTKLSISSAGPNFFTPRRSNQSDYETESVCSSIGTSMVSPTHHHSNEATNINLSSTATTSTTIGTTIDASQRSSLSLSTGTNRQPSGTAEDHTALTGSDCFDTCDQTAGVGLNHLQQSRRSTLASGSSSSSIASTESHWSAGSQSVKQTRATHDRQLAKPQAIGRSVVSHGSNIAASISHIANGGGNAEHQHRANDAHNQSVCMMGSQWGSTSTNSTNRSGSLLTSGLSAQSHAHSHSLGHAHQHTSCSVSFSGQGHTSSSMCASSRAHAQSSAQLSGPQRSSNILLLASLNPYDLLLYSLDEITEFDQNSTRTLARGLYLGFVQLQTTVESMRLLVTRSRPNMIPCSRIRDNAHVSKGEWELLRSLLPPANQRASSEQASVRSRHGSQQNNQSINLSRSNESLPTSMPSYLHDNSDHRSHQTEARGATHNHLVASSELSANQERGRAKSVSPDGCGPQTSSGQSGHQQQQQSGSQDNSHLQEVRRRLRQERMADSQQTNSGAAPACDGFGVGRTSAGPEENLSASPTREGAAHSDTDLSLRINHTNPRITNVGSDDLFMRSSRIITGSDNNLGTFNATSVASEVSSSEYNLASASAERLAGPCCKLSAAAARDDDSHSELSMLSAGNDSQSARPHDVGVYYNNRCRAAYSRGGHDQRAHDETFVRLVGDAARRLISELKSQLPKTFDEERRDLVSILPALNDDQNNRIYHIELIELSNQITFILLLPAPENVCPVTPHEKANMLADNREYMLLPLQMFETIHIGTYEPDLLSKYSRLSSFLETELIVAQHDHRQAFSSRELKETKTRVTRLQDMVSIADEFWRQLRWLVDVVSFARDKTHSGSLGCIRLGTIWTHLNDQFNDSWCSMKFESNVDMTCEDSMPYGASDFARNIESADQFEKDSSMNQRIKEPVARKSNHPAEPRSDGVQSTRPHIGDQNTKDSTKSQIARNKSVGSRELCGSQYRRGPIQGAPVPGHRRYSDDVLLKYDAKSLPADAKKKQELRATVASAATQNCRIVVLTSDNELKEFSGHDEFYPEALKGYAQPEDSGHVHINSTTDGSKYVINPRESDDERQDEDDEDAIYAYHISLRDATRVATERKSSQQSVNVNLVDSCGFELHSKGEMGVSEHSACNRSQTQEGTQRVRHSATSAKIQANEDTSDKCSLFGHSGLSDAANSNSVSVGRPFDYDRATDDSKDTKHYKTTNPFLSDTLD